MTHFTNLLGRRARGKYNGVNPKYDRKRSGEPDNEYNIPITVDGDIVAVSFSESGTSMYLWLLDDECQVRSCCSYVVLPHDHQGPLR